MSETMQKTVVTVTIAGDDYTLRADATPEYAQECAAYVDRCIREIREQGPLIQQHKAAILGALAITDQLFKARRELDALRAQTAEHVHRLTAQIEDRLASSDLAAHS
ncbi:MAG: cell division protein ZapA [Longimicrobiales bacterium]